MAVVQISRIQIRRGKINSGTGLPQLASGEMAWAVDSQELYIGNGSVAEGAPGVGNTKILTLNDLTSQGNILNIVTYIYKPNDLTTITGQDANNPTIRTLQDRVDEVVSVLSFGAIGDGITDDTVALQRAIDQLYLNSATKASNDTNDGIASRKALMFPAGVYKTTSTLYVPSYATLIGVGADKTVIAYDPSGSVYDPAIVFVNDDSSINNFATISSTDYDNQPRGIFFNGLTITISNDTNSGMQLDCVRDSYFENINITGSWSGTLATSAYGIKLNAKSSVVTCTNNIFKNVKFKALSYAVVAPGDVKTNQFKYCEVETCYQGFVLGEGADGFTIGYQFGPRETNIVETIFTDVKRHAIYLDLGSKNSTRDNTYNNVGNEGGGNTVAVYPQVYFGSPGNTSHGDISDRPDDLATANELSVYVPEVAGHGLYVPNFYSQVDLGYQLYPVLAFRLPIATDQNSAPNGTIVYKIDYFYKSRTHSFSRRGTITIAADVDNGNIQLSDEFDIACDGTVTEADQLKLDFQAKFMDQNGAEYTGAPGQLISTISVFYVNDYSADAGSFNYSYSSSF